MLHAVTRPLGCLFLLLGIQKLLGLVTGMNTVQDILSVILPAGLLSKVETQQMKTKEGTALDNLDPKGTILYRVIRTLAGPSSIQWGKEWDFLASSLPLT